MPYVRKSKKKTSYARKRFYASSKAKASSRRRYTRRNNNNRGNVLIASQRPTVQRGYLPLGRTYFAKLPYVENFAISCDGTTGLSTVALSFSSNNVYDPQLEVGGHQPLQYDILAAHYERVWVWGAAVTLTFTNPTFDGMWVGYRVRSQTNSTASSAQTLSYLQETRDTAIRPLNNTGSQTTVFKFYVSNPKVFGINKQQYSNLEYSHTAAASPAVQNYIEPFGIHSVSGETGVVRVNVKITYYCQFTNPISEPQN